MSELVSFVNMSTSYANPVTVELAEPEGEDIYQNLSLRLLSYANWPNRNISRELLASAGFYYVGGVRGETGDRVRCAWCGGEVDDWLPGQCPVNEHARSFPDCEYIKEVTRESSVTLSQLYNSDLIMRSKNEDLGIVVQTPPVRPKYMTFISRLNTFHFLPKKHVKVPEDLACAGFYYIGPNDRVRCFYCGLKLSFWKSTDNPWVEHAKFFPGCCFLNMIKGKQFIETCLKSTYVLSDEVPSLKNSKSQPRKVSFSDVESFMESPCVIFVLKCGIHAERIRAVIHKRLLETGTSYVNPLDLLLATLNGEIEVMPFDILESHSYHRSRSSTPNFRNLYLENQYDVEDDDDDDENIINFEDVASGEVVDGDVGDEKADAGSDVPAQNNDNVEEGDRNAAEGVNDENAPSPRELSLQQENKQLKDSRTCKICLDKEVSVVFLPCGHLVSCAVCSTGLLQCPVCRARVRGIVRTYLA